MDFRTKPDTHDDLSLFAGDDRRPPSFELRATVAPPSAAWLLAQSAFAMPELSPAQQPQPVVVVRKGRGLLRTVNVSPMSGAARGDTGPLSPAAKSPRVFRLGQRVAEVNAPPAAPLPQLARPLSTGRYRRHRFDADKKPGPVLQLFQAPVIDEGIFIETPNIDVGLSNTEAAALLEMLVKVNRSIEDSLMAGTFEFAPASMNWREFGADVQQMQLQLQQIKSP